MAEVRTDRLLKSTGKKGGRRGLDPSRRSEPPAPRPDVASSCPRDLPRGGRGGGGGERQRHLPWAEPGGPAERPAPARRRAPSWIRVVTRVTTETGRASETSTVSGGLRCLPVLPDEGAQRSARMPLSQSKQRRRISPSWRSTCFRPPRVGAGRTSGKRQEIGPRLVVPMCNNVSQGRDQASGPSVRSALGYDVRTRLSLVKTSHTPGAPSARGRDESEATPDRAVNVLKQEGQRPLRRRVRTHWQTSPILKPCPRSQFTGMSPASCPAG